MNYNDFSILTDGEYLKLAKEYNNHLSNNNDNIIDSIYSQIENCKNYLYLNNAFINKKLNIELNNHLQVLTKLSNNIKLIFSPKENNKNNFNNFNLFNYLSKLIEIQNYLNNWLKTENNLNYKNFIFKLKNELNNICISLLNILSKLNIYFFKYM